MVWLLAIVLAAETVLDTPKPTDPRCFERLDFRVQWLNSRTAHIIATSKKLNCAETDVLVTLRPLKRLAVDTWLPEECGPGRGQSQPPEMAKTPSESGGVRTAVFEASTALVTEKPSAPASAAFTWDGKAAALQALIPVYRKTDDSGEGRLPVDFACLPLLDDGGKISVEYQQVGAVKDATALGAAKPIDDQFAIFDPHRLRFDAGLAMVMTKDGKFVGRPELALNSTSRWFGALGAAIDLRYVNANTDAANPSLNTPGTFEGTARALVYLFDPQQWKVPAVALVGGGGMRSAIGGDELTATSSLFGGLRLNVLSYNPTDAGEDNVFAGSRSFVELGYAWDKNWSHENRFYADGQLEIPGLKTKWVHFMLRAHLDRPIFQHGPIDLRISALASIDPKALTGFFGLPEQ